MTWAGRISELERRQSVLQGVGKGKETALFGEDVSDRLDGGFVLLAAEYVGEPFVVVLLVHDILGVLLVASLAERDTALGDVGCRKVIEGCGTYVLILCYVSIYPYMKSFFPN